MPSDIFDGPKSVCRWAGKEIDDFEAAEQTFFNDHPGREREQLDLATGEMVHLIAFDTPPTEPLIRGAYRVVGDLRNALDQAVYAAAKAFGAERLRKTNFPFGETEADFWAALTAPKGHYRDIPAELHPVLSSFRPFWSSERGGDGNDVLRGLAYIANPNKHHVPLGVSPQTGMRFYGGRNITSLSTLWDGKAETELYRYPAGQPYEIDIQLEPRIAFADAGRLTGKPALRTFRHMLSEVDSIVLALEAETARLLGDR